MLMMRQPELSRTEWQAVAIALRDAERAPAREGMLARAFRAMTGASPARPLADSRLEAIRAFICATRRRGQAPAVLTNALEAQGFSTVQIAALGMLAR